MSSLPDTRSLRWARSRIVAIARALLRVPDYDSYLAHQTVHHADSRPLTRSEFFAQRQSARFGRGSSRCC